MIYQIFGKRLKFSFDDSLVSAILKEELLLYSGGEGADFDVEIEIGSKTEVPVRLSNPKGHLDFANGFAMQASSHILFFHFSDQRPSKVRVHINQPRNAFVSRLLSSQFTSTPETAGQIVHELVLVPIMFFFPDRFPIHASGFQTPSGKAALVGGTGGAGKTSLEIQFARLPGFQFLTDDIAVMSNSGQVWPNFAYPKIYGYNLKNDERLRKTIFYNRGPIDRLHWKLHSLRGLDIVRRRIRPDHLYLETVSDSSELSHYFILARSNQDDLSIQRIDERQSSVLTNYVLRAEYGYIFNHLLWHQYNRTILSEKPIITVDELFERWQTAAESVFNKVLCYLVRIPASVPHEEIMPRLVSLIREKLGE